MGKYESAERDLRQSISIDEKNPYVYRNLAVLALKRSEYETAIKQLNIALDKNEELPLANYYLGEVYRAQEKLDEACKYYKISAALDEPKGVNAVAANCN